MKHRRMISVGWIFLFLIPFSSHAVPILNSSGNVAISILGLNIDGQSYNAFFTANGSFDDVFGTGAPTTTFWGDSSGAGAAVDAINDFLNTYPTITNVGSGTGTGEFENDYLVPFGFSSGTVVSSARGNYGFDVDPDVWQQLDTFNRERALQTVSWVTFTVPEPTTLALLGLGLAGLGFTRSRMKA